MEIADVLMRPCLGCGGLVPDAEVPVHSYMESSPGCWLWYGELNAVATYRRDSADLVRWHTVDCFAVQHPGGAHRDRRQRKSVAVHLTSLCLVQDFGVPAARMPELRQRMSATVLPRLGLDDWPYLARPESLGAVTVADVRKAVEIDAFAETVNGWSAAAWQAWWAHHEVVRRFAHAALGGAP